ncbi:MAG: response regulator [Deltaproteobacteria bacterium]|nr:response regulator [Deltaproteobacteria bacterium]
MPENSKEGGLRILLADDDPSQLNGVSRYLSRAGFSVMTCEDGEEAIAALEGMPFDVLISDVQMPKTNGLALADWVICNRPAIRIVIMTAFGSSVIYQSAMRKGATLYLEKPVDPKLLVEILRTPDDLPSGRTELMTAFADSTREHGNGEVVVRIDNNVGRVFFADGLVAWAMVSTQPGLFLSALKKKTGLGKDAIEEIFMCCRSENSNVVNRLVKNGHVSESTMREILKSNISGCIREMKKWAGARAMYVPVNRPFEGQFTFELSEVLTFSQDPPHPSD